METQRPGTCPRARRRARSVQRLESTEIHLSDQSRSITASLPVYRCFVSKTVKSPDCASSIPPACRNPQGTAACGQPASEDRPCTVQGAIGQHRRPLWIAAECTKYPPRTIPGSQETRLPLTAPPATAPQPSDRRCLGRRPPIGQPRSESPRDSPARCAGWVRRPRLRACGAPRLPRCSSLSDAGRYR